MIMLSRTPCERCIYFDKIITLDSKKEKQYIGCKKAKKGVALELLKISQNKITCNKFKEV